MKVKIDPFTAAFVKDPSGGYVAYLVEMEGINTQGETLEEAQENLLDAFKGMIEIKRAEAQKLKNTTFQTLNFAA